MTATQHKRQRTAAIVLGALFLLFIVPYFFAYFARQAPQDFTTTTNNYGTLIVRPVDIRTLKLTTSSGEPIYQHDTPRLVGKWLYLVENFGPCEKACDTSLYNIRQIRKAMGKNQNRVIRAIVTNTKKDTHLSDALKGSYQGTAWLHTSQATFQQAMQQADTGQFSKPGTVYLVDPLGNILMVYPPDANNSLMYKDLKRVIGASQIG